LIIRLLYPIRGKDCALAHHSSLRVAQVALSSHKPVALKRAAPIREDVEHAREFVIDVRAYHPQM
jgi:hypothetical protein